jgi:hypothetical protein
MVSKKLVYELSSINSLDKFFEECVIGKHPSSFPKAAEYRANNPLKLMHSNIYGLIRPSSVDKNRYFITFINDFFHKI